MFGKLEALFHEQDNKLDEAALGTESVWLCNLELGYRFKRGKGELRAGIENLLDEDFRLNPLNGDRILSHERLLYLSFRWNL